MIFPLLTKLWKDRHAVGCLSGNESRRMAEISGSLQPRYLANQTGSFASPRRRGYAVDHDFTIFRQDCLFNEFEYSIRSIFDKNKFIDTIG
jgi:hypothetical protein